MSMPTYEEVRAQLEAEDKPTPKWRKLKWKLFDWWDDEVWYHFPDWCHTLWHKWTWSIPYLKWKAPGHYLVDCRNSYYDPTPYRGGWHDRDGLLLLANFNILADFMEQEDPGKIISWTDECEPDHPMYDPEKAHAHAWDELTHLYYWWKWERKEKWEEFEKLQHEWAMARFPKGGPTFVRDEEIKTDGDMTLYKIQELEEKSEKADKLFRQVMALENALELEDDANLLRLMKVRKFMWT